MKQLLSSMFLLLIMASCFFCVSCHSKMAPQRSVDNRAVYDRSVYNQEVKDAGGNPMLLGKCTRERLQQAPFNSWFVTNYADYTVDSATADRLGARLAGTHFVIFMGTWCGDSRREVPRMFKLLDYCGVPASSIRLIMVNSSDSLYKQSPGHEEKGLNIFRVPDLLMFDDNREMGRIVESPVVSLEKDMLALVNGDIYTPQYRGVAFLIREFAEKTPAELENDLSGVAAEVKPLLHSPGELNSYAHVLRAAGEKEKAAWVQHLNSLIFPQGK
jgi:hypothetical protein